MTVLDTTVYPRTHTGIGLSNHKNDFNTGVRIGNWVENDSNAKAGRGVSILDMRFGRDFSTTHRSTYNDKDKTGPALLQSKTIDIQENKHAAEGQPLEHIFHHKLHETSPVEFFGTTYDLAYAGNKARVQDYLWSDSKFHNRVVPVAAGHNTVRGIRSAGGFGDAAVTQRIEKDETFLTTNQAFYQRPSGVAPPRTQAARPADPQGQAAQVGRKVTGEFAASLDSGFLKTGFRRAQTSRR